VLGLRAAGVVDGAVPGTGDLFVVVCVLMVLAPCAMGDVATARVVEATTKENATALGRISGTVLRWAGTRTIVVRVSGA
jgi:hypothetical protein